jgi:hypothetical protein
MEKALIVLGTPIIPDQEMTLTIQPAKGALHHPSMPSEPCLRLDASTRNPGADAARATRPATLGMIVRVVRVDFPGAAAWTPRSPAAQRRNGVEQGLEELTVVDIRPTQLEDERDPLGVDHKMAFATRLAFIRWIRADAVAPFFAATLELSRATRLQSISLAQARCWSKCRWSFFQIPRFVQVWKRRQQVDPLPHPISGGKNCQGTPVRRTNRRPVNTARLDTRGRPPRQLGRRSRGRWDSTIAHNSSLTRGFMLHDTPASWF